MKKLSVLLLLVFLLLSLATGCSPKEPVNETPALEESPVETSEAVDKDQTVYPLTLVDGKDRQVIIEKQPQTIVSLAPSVTETLFAIGGGELLVGRTDYCLFPEEALAVDSIGSLREPNIEAIAALNPDLVIAATHFSEEVLAQLEALNIPVVILSAQESFEGVYETTLKAGLLINHQAQAQALVAEMQAEVADITAKLSGVTPVTVYYVVGFGDADYTATGDTFINDMLQMAGGDNVAKDAEGWAYSLEKLLEHDPQVVLVSDKYDSYAGFMASENYQALTAVQNEGVIEIDSDLLSIQGPRLAKGLRAIAERLHPQLF